MVRIYRKKPVDIRAVQWTGDNLEECKEFLGEDFVKSVLERHPNGRAIIKIRTKEGELDAVKDDFIIEGVQGEHYPCKPDIFRETYEPVK